VCCVCACVCVCVVCFACTSHTHSPSQSSPILEWGAKYKSKGKALLPPVIAVYGRQILEGIEFLKSKDLPYGQLHSGNIMCVNGVCQVAGYENALLGFSSKLHPLIRPLIKGKDEKNKDVEDVLCFGHLLFEVAMGFELDACRPDIDQLVGKCPVEIIEVSECVCE
jgi:PX domain-containing protein kinase-like protein